MTRRFFFGILSGSLLASCVADNSLCPEDQPGTDPNNEVWLSIRVNQQGIAEPERSITRAGDTYPDDEGHPAEAATPEENYIDSQDLCLILFTSQGRTMKTLTPKDFTLTAINEQTKGEYRIMTKVNRAYMDLANGSMSILAVANTKGIGRTDLFTTSYNVVSYLQHLDDLTAEMRGFGYDGITSIEDATAWQPNIDENRHIPMAGYAKMIINQADLDKANTPENALNFDEIVMQRSMLKIRIIDGIKNQTNLPAHTEITKVTYCSGTTRGAYVPNTSEITAWSNGTTILEQATVPSETGMWNNTGSKNPTFKGASISDTNDDGTTQNYDNVFECYATETQISLLKNTTFRPYFVIETTEDGGNVTSHTIYLDQCISHLGQCPDLARNHIYQFTQVSDLDFKQ